MASSLGSELGRLEDTYQKNRDKLIDDFLEEVLKKAAKLIDKDKALTATYKPDTQYLKIEYAKQRHDEYEVREPRWASLQFGIDDEHHGVNIVISWFDERSNWSEEMRVERITEDQVAKAIVADVKSRMP